MQVILTSDAILFIHYKYRFYRMGFEGVNAMPVNQQFIEGEQTSILVRGGEEVSGIVESFSTLEGKTVLTLLIGDKPVEFEFISGRWIEADAQVEEMREAA